MKQKLLWFGILFPCIILAQDFDEVLEEVRVAEAKSALNQMMHRANLNTGNYDLKYHRLDLDLDPSVNFISGDITSYFVASDDLDQITFELASNMVVSGVTQRGNTLAFTHNADDEVIITLDAIQSQGVLDSLTISYSGIPISTGFASFVQENHAGDPVIWTLSEPYGAKAWWPCKQDLIDKIDSIDVFITSPRFNPSNEEYVAVSNGLEQSQLINGNQKTTHYKHRYPIPAYLIAIAVTNYQVYTHQVTNDGNPFDIVNYVYPESFATAQASTAITVDIMDLFIDLFEAYPFENEKYGHAQFGFNGGMEHTTVSFMGGYSRNLIAHELAHQWFGNKITCGSWKDIWLNEGFASYLSGMVYENLDGNNAFRNWKQQRINSITSAPDGAVYLSDADTTNVSRIFSGRLSYNKGGMVLHMLRKKLGDAIFFQAIQNYLADPDLAFDYAKTEDLITILESTSGEDLTEFFDDWLFNEGYPSYTLSWSQPNSGVINIQLDQMQSHPSVSFFEAPVPVRLLGSLGEIQDLTLDHTFDGQQFTENVGFQVDQILFNPEFDLISRNNQVLSLSDVPLERDLRIYPNPTSGILHIEKPNFLEVVSIRIYTTLGELLYDRDWSDTIDISELSTGILFLQLETTNGIINKRLLKK